MSYVPKLVLPTVTALACFCGGSGPAYAGQSGGAQAPSAPLAGGTEYGALAPSRATARPIVRELSVPATAVAGRPPRVALRIDEVGDRSVQVRVTVIDLPTRRVVINVGMGWVPTGRTVTVDWPRSATLKPGNYQLSLSARDHGGATLLRRAHSSAHASLWVKTPVRAPAGTTPALVEPSAGVPEAGVPTPEQSAAAGAVFPVAATHNFGGPENRFGAPRGNGRTHQGQDVLTAEGSAVVAPFAGTILTASYQAGGAGYYAVEHTDVGFDFMFAHCRAGLAVGTGQAVAAGQLLCQAGQTGSATTPHLHFEMWVGGWQASTGHPIDPLPYLKAWDHGGAGA